jgi:hypothetical protein
MMKIWLLAQTLGILIAIQSPYARGAELKFAYISIIVDADEVNPRQFLTFPHIYLRELCETKRIELLQQLNQPKIGSRDTHATAKCGFINEKDIANLELGLREIQASKFISDVRFQRNMIVSTSDGYTLVLPNFNLISREVCIKWGQSSVLDMIGVRLDADGTKVESADFNCTRIDNDDVRSMLKQLKEAGR